MSDALAKAAILEELGESGRETLSDFLEPRTYEDGFLLFQEDQEASEMLFISDGQVALRKDGEEIACLAEGDSLGCVSLVVIGRRECEAVANGRVEALALTRQSYLRLRADYPAVALDLQEGILRQVSGAARELVDDID